MGHLTWYVAIPVISSVHCKINLTRNRRKKKKVSDIIALEYDYVQQIKNKKFCKIRFDAHVLFEQK